MSTQSNIQFAQWLQKNDPFLFEVALRTAELKKQRRAEVNGLFDFVGDINWADIGSSVVDTVTKVAPAVVQYKSQAAALKLNMQRAKQGLPPVDTTAYQPTVKIAAQITPENEAAINRIASQAVSDTGDKLKQYIPYALGGVGLYLVAKKMKVI